MENLNSAKDQMIEVIRKHQYYKAGVLESKSYEEVFEIYNDLLDWIEE